MSVFANQIILDNFHKIGKYEYLNTALNMYVIRIMAFLLRHLPTSDVIKSKLGDFLVSV